MTNGLRVTISKPEGRYPRLVPGQPSGNVSSTRVYEDDGNSTAYLDGASHVWTDCNVSKVGATTVVRIQSVSGGAKPYAKFPTDRSYQIRMPNGLPPSRVGVSVGMSTAILDVPFVRFGAVEAARRAPQPAAIVFFARAVCPPFAGTTATPISVFVEPNRA